MSKFDPNSFKCIFLVYSRVQKGYRCYCPSLRRNLVSTNVTFLENASFSQDLIHTSQEEDDNFLVYTLASATPASMPPLTKPRITEVYTLLQHPTVSSPPLTFDSYDHLSSHSCFFIASLDSISLPNKVLKPLLTLVGVVL